MSGRPVRVAVVGATGFLGSAVAAALRDREAHVVLVRAPRLSAEGAERAGGLRAGDEAVARSLARELAGSDVVVGCAGIASATSAAAGDLLAANGLLPGVIGRAAVLASCSRYVHLSSAAVQGPVPTLDDSDLLDPFSPYARSKVVGERTARAHGPAGTVVYRPPSVHGPGRAETRLLVRLARSPLRSVAAPGQDPTPVAHVDNVAAAVAHLALTASPPPPVVSHPWEGLSTASLLEHLGGRPAHRVPRRAAVVLLRTAGLLARVRPGLLGHVRRLEVLWFGQGQGRSWLSTDGFVPCADPARWRSLGGP